MITGDLAVICQHFMTIGRFQLGWPISLSWGTDLPPICCEFRGGSVFRISPES